MNVEEEYLSLQEQCRKKILKSVYIMTGVLFGMEILIYVLMKAFHTGMVENDLNYILFYILTPSLINVGCVLAARFAVLGECTVQRKSQALILCILCICLVTATFHGLFLMTSCTFVIPIIVSIMFDSRRLTGGTTALSVLFMLIGACTASLFDNTWSLKYRILSGLVGAVLIVMTSTVCMSLLYLNEEKNAIIRKSCRMNEEMQHALKRDAMTGLYNHTEFYKRLDQHYRECHVQSGQLTVAVLDVDFFKRVNDAYGHECGDAVLIRLADVLMEYCQEYGDVFRYGGEEFAVISRRLSERQMAERMDRVRKVVNELKFDFMPEGQLSFSCGIYEYQGDKMLAQEIFSRADRALYRAKEQGRNRCVCHSDL